MIKLINLTQLQQRQYLHDKDFHPDILGLSTADRLKHFTLHNAKYAARFAAEEEAEDSGVFLATLTDAFVIILATANTLLQKLDLETTSSSPNTLSRHNMAFSFTRGYLSHVGKMAKACESIDHLEAFPFRETITDANLALAKLVWDEGQKREVDLIEAYVNRIEDVESRSGFAFLTNED
jgi:hypothetical protein